ncbi:ABC transporter ATP-binding protein/permease [Flavobacteriales bacterium]|nr:ABC transporter ATP-binding protein/permease [Flavobacteriales bacterium]
MSELPLTSFKRFINLLKVDKKDVFAIYYFALFRGLVTLSLPLGIQAIINLITGGEISTSWIVLLIFVVAGVAISGVMQIYQLSISESIQQKIFTRSAFEFAYRMPRLKLEAVWHKHLPELTNRFFDTLTIQKGITKMLMDFSSASLQVIFGMILLSIYHPYFIFFSIGMLVTLYVLFKYTIPKGLKSSLKESRYKYEVAHWLEEIARTMETFKLSGKSDLVLNKTDEVVKEYLGARDSHFQTLKTQYYILVTIQTVVVLALLLIGGLLVINQKMNIGQFVASEVIILLLMGSMEKVILSMESIYDVLTGVEKIGEVLDIPLDNNDNSIEFKDNYIDIELSDVSYKFIDNNNPMINHVNLQVNHGDKICMSGFPDSGKTVLAELIAGIYDNYQGTITCNKILLQNWNKEDIFYAIGDNLEGEAIFEASLMENITLGREKVTIDQVKKIGSILGFEEQINRLDDGYNTKLMPQGKNISRCLKRKIILARAVVGEPRLILLEDQFASLSRGQINAFMSFLIESDFSVIIISNDINIAKRMDRSWIIDKGELKFDNNWSALQNEDLFKNIFELN